MSARHFHEILKHDHIADIRVTALSAQTLPVWNKPALQNDFIDPLPYVPQEAVVREGETDGFAKQNPIKSPTPRLSFGEGCNLHQPQISPQPAMVRSEPSAPWESSSCGVDARIFISASKTIVQLG